jgi:hypothetical protein
MGTMFDACLKNRDDQALPPPISPRPMPMTLSRGRTITFDNFKEFKRVEDITKYYKFYQ